ncbi:M20 family metallopeptidase [uncultured Enterovirga sp.]|uniref:M20 family metallopeptidase n=1 Tax=uncultured Enterovirga sp. TaxID=2026352 RepID=UPI0035CAA9C8
MRPSFDEADLVRGISAWTAVESPTSDPAGVNRVMDLAFDEASTSSVAVERVAGRDGLGDSVILRAGPGSGDPGILVLSHLDTVHPLGTLARDLPIRRDGDRLYGPGIYDMKGGAYLAFRAFLAVAKSGAAPRPMTFLFTSDEEIGSPTTRGIIEDLGRRASAVLVTEPARDGGKCVTSRKGVGRFEFEVEGRPAHSGSRHPDGRSAIREAAMHITSIEGMTDYDRGITTTVGLVSGGTAQNVIPQHCRFSVDLRVVTASDGEALEEKLLALQPRGPDIKLRITGGMNRPPYERTEAIAALYEQARALAAEIGLDLGEVPRTGGGSDGNFTAALGIPTLDGLGVDGDGAHTLSEHALVSSFVPRARLMASLLQNLR